MRATGGRGRPFADRIQKSSGLASIWPLLSPIKGWQLKETEAKLISLRES